MTSQKPEKNPPLIEKFFLSIFIVLKFQSSNAVKIQQVLFLNIKQTYFIIILHIFFYQKTSALKLQRMGPLSVPFLYRKDQQIVFSRNSYALIDISDLLRKYTNIGI